MKTNLFSSNKYNPVVSDNGIKQTMCRRTNKMTDPGFRSTYSRKNP